MAELAGVMVGDYFLLERLAREGSVETYQARPMTRGGYDVLLRLFRPQFPDASAFQEHFANEVEKVWRCHHPYVLPLLEFGTGRDLLYTVTVLPDAKSLEHILAYREEQLSLDVALALVTQLCSVVHYLHQHGIVHGNIQPSSIFVQSDGDVLLTNFSMRRAYQQGEPLVSFLEEGNALYTAPEQSLGMVSPSSDVYALGVILYHLLSGVTPYNGATAGDIALHQTDDPVPSLRAFRVDVPEALEGALRIALANNPGARFQSTQALAQALLSALVPSPVDAEETVSGPKRIPVRSRRTRFGWLRAIS